MKLMTFSEINDLENGQQIPALQGTVKKVFDQLTGEGQYGIWWLQSFIMTDDHANEIKCTWSAEDKIDELEGKTIIIESGRDKKDQLAGIKKEIKNKKGKRYETVKLDDRCTIRKLNGDKSDNATPTDKGIGNMAKKAWAESEQRNHDSNCTEAEKPPETGYTTAKSFNPPKHSILDERQRAIIRQHSQSMALEVLKLKIGINQLILEDLTPSKLKTLADYFDNDVLGAAQ